LLEELHADISIRYRKSGRYGGGPVHRGFVSTQESSVMFLKRSMYLSHVEYQIRSFLEAVIALIALMLPVCGCRGFVKVLEQIPRRGRGHNTTRIGHPYVHSYPIDEMRRDVISSRRPIFKNDTTEPTNQGNVSFDRAMPCFGNIRALFEPVHLDEVLL
jgi:hypothetical protein